MNIDQPDQRAVLQKTVERFAATKGLPAMVATHAVPAAASIGDGELALQALRRQAGDLHPNGMWYPNPCLESSLSSANGIQTMFLQSWGDKIRVFPAMPKEWGDAVFHDLRAEGAFLVSARRAGGRTQWLRVKSLAGEPCRVLADFRAEPRIVAGDAGIMLKPLGGGVYELGLAKGQEVTLAAAEVTGPQVVEPLPAQPEFVNSFGLNKAWDRTRAPISSNR
jgi:alpha-L-fucosidase 2